MLLFIQFLYLAIGNIYPQIYDFLGLENYPEEIREYVRIFVAPHSWRSGVSRMFY